MDKNDETVLHAGSTTGSVTEFVELTVDEVDLLDVDRQEMEQDLEDLVEIDAEDQLREMIVDAPRQVNGKVLVSKGQAIARIQWMAKFVAAGLWSVHELRQLPEVQAWEIADTTLGRYVRKARELVCTIDSKSIAQKRQKYLRQLDLLIKENFDKGRYAEVRKCIQLGANISGAMQSRNKEATIPIANQQVNSRFADKWDKVLGSGEKEGGQNSEG